MMPFWNGGFGRATRHLTVRSLVASQQQRRRTRTCTIRHPGFPSSFVGSPQAKTIGKGRLSFWGHGAYDARQKCLRFCRRLRCAAQFRRVCSCSLQACCSDVACGGRRCIAQLMFVRRASLVFAVGLLFRLGCWRSARPTTRSCTTWSVATGQGPPWRRACPNCLASYAAEIILLCGCHVLCASSSLAICRVVGCIVGLGALGCAGLCGRLDVHRCKGHRWTVGVLWSWLGGARACVLQRNASCLVVSVAPCLSLSAFAAHTRVVAPWVQTFLCEGVRFLVGIAGIANTVLAEIIRASFTSCCSRMGCLGSGAPGDFAMQRHAL